MAVEQLSEQILLIALPRESRYGNELEIAASMANTKPSRHVVIDFSSARVMTSAMLSQLMVLERQLDAFDRKLILCSVPPGIRKIFRCVGLQSLFRFVEDRETALESLGTTRDGPPESHS
jgi:anti-anti-sigma regulatory factor